MATILFFVFFGIVCKSIRSSVRRRPRRVAASVPVESKVSRSLSALRALQAQRDILEDQIRGLEDLLDNCPPENKRHQYLTQQAVLYGKLATCESKITRLCCGS